MAETIEAVVDGGSANAGPLAPTLGPLGVNMGEVINQINEKTAEFKGMKVPVKIVVDDKKNVTISVGTPPASALIKEKLGIPKGAGNARTDVVGDLSAEQAISIAKMKGDDLMGADLKAKVKEVVGTCVSMGVTFEGVNAREAMGKFAAGDYDHHFQ